MLIQLESLAVVLLVAALAPFVASLVPNRAIPEVVFLVFAGALLGPSGLGLIDAHGQSMHLLSELGMAFLFLMAGYEVEVGDLRSRTGAFASLSWAISLAAGLVLVAVSPFRWFDGMGGVAFALMLTTTAYGTLAPIMRARELGGTPVGRAVTVYGATGEVFPILAMALLLSTREKGVTVALICVFVAICARIVTLPRTTRRIGEKFREFLRSNAGSASQALLRLVVLLVVFLTTLAISFDLDGVLGAFAAGFVLRALFPEGDPALEEKLEGIASGFMVPVFFVVSGAGINLSAAFSDPLLMVTFIVALFVVRGVPIAITLRLNPDTRAMGWAETFVTTTYCVMALPLVVAIANVAVTMGVMTPNESSVLVTAGAITVMLVPVITSLVRQTSDAHPIVAVHELAHGEHLAEVIHQHALEHHHAQAHFEEVRERLGVHHGIRLSSAEYLARMGELDGESPADDGQDGAARD